MIEIGGPYYDFAEEVKDITYPEDKNGRKTGGIMMKLRYYIFTMRWLWKNRTWENTRQKYKALDRAQKEYLKGISKENG